MSDTVKKVLGILMAFVTVICCILSVIPAEDAPKVRTYKGSGRNGKFLWPPFPEGTIAVNLCDQDELQMLNGIGETLSHSIMEEREQNGPFYFPEDLISVKGIGNAKLDGLRDMLDMQN